MNFSTYTTALCLLLFFFGVTYSQKKNPSVYPENKERLQRFYLIGDTGHNSSKDGLPALNALDAFLQTEEHTGKEYVLFLGDNFPGVQKLPWSASMPGLEKFKDRHLYLSGEQEWQRKGIEGLKETQSFLEEKYQREDVFVPKPGCAFSFIDISDEVHLIVLNTQWFLANWNEHPLINDDCPEIKTREAMFLEIETELKKNQNKTTIFALHHPLRSNGVHGGKFSWSSNIVKEEGSLPIPVVGQLVNFLRTSGGISRQDMGNPQYRSLVSRLQTLAGLWGKVVFVSGHDHSLQYLEDENIKQVVAGSGSSKTYVRKDANALFAAKKEGFAVLDVFKDGSSQIRFFGSDNGDPNLLYQHQVFEKEESYDVQELSESFPATVKASIYSEKETEKSDFYRKLWGDRYRKLYEQPVEVPVAILDTLYGGLQPMRSGGGHQTTSLRVRDTTGREYNFRKLRKDPTQFLQATAYKNKPIEEMFEETFAAKMIRDFFTASHPYAFLAVPVLADAAGVFHTNPEIYYLPKQKSLEDYNTVHGDAIYMIEERPEENWLEYESFGKPNHDIQSTDGMFDRLRRDEKYSLDEAAYIRARMFDMLIGDWDRHNDQWRWAEIEQENGNRIFKPIPRDRDQVFSNFDGLVFDKLRKLIGFINQFGKYDTEITDLDWFNRSAANLDRVLVQSCGRQEWIKQAELLQKAITDEVINEAFSRLPEEAQGTTTNEIIENLKGRKDNLVKFATEYYDLISEIGIMTGTDKDDFIDVERLENGDTHIRISRNKDGKREEVVSERTFRKMETDEIWVYGLDDEDQFFVKGEKKPGIKVRLIGGQNNDVYTLSQGAGIRVYDYKSKKNRIEENRGGKIFRTDNYQINVFDKNHKIIHKKNLLPYVGYNPDNGVILGVQTSFTKNGLVRKPFTTKHSISAGYFFATGGFEAAYSGEFAHPEFKYNFLAGADYSSAKNTINFFGFGNETRNSDDVYSRDYNRIRVESFGAEAGLVRRTLYGSTFTYKALFEGVEVEATPARFISEAFSENEDFFDQMFYAGLEGAYSYESLDSRINPARGLIFHLTAGGKLNLKETGRHFYYVNPFLEVYTPLTANERLVLNPRMQSQLNFREDFEFYHAATLGGKTGLRSFRHERFTGTRAFAAGTDLRYNFKTLKNNFLPVQVGVLAGYDLGRVWMNEEHSEKWHHSYGGGLWLAIAEAAAGEVNLFHGKEGFRFSFGFQMGL